MARRQTSQREVTNVVPYQSGDMAGAIGNLIDQATGQYKQFKQKQDVIKMNEYLADSDIAMTKATREWQAQNEADPMNPEAIKGLHAKYDSIMSGYDSGISVVSRGKWKSAKSALKYQYGKSLSKWSMDQSVLNTVDTVEKALQKNSDLAVEQGRVFDEAGRQRSFERMKATLEASSDRLGVKTVADTLDLHRSDQLKSYVSGMIESDPDRAERLLNMKEFRKDIGSEKAVGVLKSMIKKQRKVNEQKQKQAQIDNNISMASDLLEDNNSHGVAELEKMNLLGQLKDVDYKRLLKFKTTTTYADSFNPKAYNDLVSKINSGMSDAEVMNEIIDNSSKIEEADAKELTKMLQTRRTQEIKSTHKVEEASVRALFDRVLSDGDLTDDEIISKFNKEINDKNANAEQIRDIAKRYKIERLKESDETFDPESVDNINKVKSYPIGARIINEATGEVKEATRDGWATIKQ